VWNMNFWFSHGSCMCQLRAHWFVYVVPNVWLGFSLFCDVLFFPNPRDLYRFISCFGKSSFWVCSQFFTFLWLILILRQSLWDLMNVSKVHRTHFSLFPIQLTHIQLFFLQQLNLIQLIVIFEINNLDYF